MSDFIEVIGFSQSLEWFTGRSLSELPSAMRQTILEDSDIPEYWGGRFTFYASIQRWKDPDFKGWTGTYGSRRIREGLRGNIIVFNVSGESRSKKKWTKDIIDTGSVILEKYPAAKRVFLQPIIGSREINPRYRASRNHPVICEAIDNALKTLGTPFLAGCIPKLPGLEGYSDRKGHLAPEGARLMHAEIFAYYEAARLHS